MGYVVRMPKLGLEMKEGVLLDWAVDEGDSVDADDVVAEIESEKTSAEVESREEGVLRHTFLDEGDAVPPGTPIGIIAAPDADVSDLVAEAESELDDAAPTPDESAAAAEESAESATESRSTGASTGGSASGKATPRARKRAEELGVDLGAVSGSGPEGAITADDVEAAESGTEEVKASPRAKRRAEDLGVDLAGVSGSGPGGAVTADDVEAAAESAGGSAGDDAGGATRTLAEERTFGGMRRSIADRLGESYRNAVHVTEHREPDAAALLAAADAADEALETDVSMPDVLLVALSAALDDHPAFNATFEEETHRLYEEHNVCVAVDIDEGLVTPVVPDVGAKSLSEIAETRREVTGRTLDGDYTMDDLRGGTFTVTNLGVLGVESFDPIINPPQIAILGVNAVSERVTMADGAPESRRVLPLDLSFDHRVVDGADAARFLQSLVGHIEDPWPLLPEGVTPADAGTDRPPRLATATTDEGMAGTARAPGLDHGYGADDGAPSPVDLFLSSLSACLSLSVRYQADLRDIDVGSIEVTADGEPATGSVERIDVTVAIDAPEAADETLDRVVELGERSCHVAELLREDLPMELSWERA
ncbi:2-oxo acid dehydrogenase subunit E2 [Halorubrum salsamenti]|uniref:2-oxo acid dehydrogenase subunit E2 n=1 Tax=Halorubrum salsamenti TaxID=2583990 RepID=UPI0011A4D9F1|nr:2-oxo acid dehydrogenase subunit E2 [Halorubrum salsamenti]